MHVEDAADAVKLRGLECSRDIAGATGEAVQPQPTAGARERWQQDVGFGGHSTVNAFLDFSKSFFRPRVALEGLRAAFLQGCVLASLRKAGTGTSGSAQPQRWEGVL